MAQEYNGDSHLHDSSDDEDDVDYMPSENEASEEDEDGDDEQEDCKDSSNIDKQRTSSLENRSKVAVDNTSTPSVSYNKARADALWADFMTDVNSQKQKSKSSSKPETKNKHVIMPTEKKKADMTSVSINSPNTKNSPTTEQNKLPDSTHSPSPVQCSSKRRPGGLETVLGFINKKQKLSTLDKSKLDWEKYKTEAGLSDELKAHINSNNTYLDKKEFLERVDQRSFEQERDARLAQSSRSANKR